MNYYLAKGCLRDKRAEFIKFAVDDIIRDAIRPR